MTSIEFLIIIPPFNSSKDPKEWADKYKLSTKLSKATVKT